MKVLPPQSPRITDDLTPWQEGAAAEVEVDSCLVADVDFAGVHRFDIDASRLVRVTAVGLVLDKLALTDVECTKLEAAALQAYKANILRVDFTDCRLTGAEFAEGVFEDCLFRNVKFDEVGFRFATFKRVRFENCMLRVVDFSNAKLAQVTFTGCDLESADFVSASCKNVDITAEDLTKVKGILGLKGATISEEQLIQLAPLLASELGFRVESTA